VVVLWRAAFGTSLCSLGVGSASLVGRSAKLVLDDFRGGRPSDRWDWSD
jgi:hypothetical protein